MTCRAVGIDVGSVCASVVAVSDRGEVKWTGYRPHHGKPLDALQELLERLESEVGRCGPGVPVAATQETPAFVLADRRVDPVVAYVRATQRSHPECRSLLVAGGERFFLVRFGEDGSYLSMRGSSSCAAGTGSFLDQQARRLDLTVDGAGAASRVSALALSSNGDRPRIASRCSVFAKTDLIHAQQEGYSLEQICDGLCHGLARNLINTVAQDDRVPGPIVFAGGVSRNDAVRRHIGSILQSDLIVDSHSHVYGALGAAIEALGLEPAQDEGVDLAHRLDRAQRSEREYHFEPLTLELSGYPDFSAHQTEIYRTTTVKPEKTVEVDWYLEDTRACGHSIDETTPAMEVRLGVDIGSTSTKAVVVDGEGRVVAGYYTRTSGAPIRAVQAILEAIDHSTADHKIVVRGAATTGSGRSFVGSVIGADLILDEITAHARAAVEIDPEVDTIIEIGGQDAKFTTLKDGSVTFSHMNTVCAAGTGSFLEEQADKLEVPLSAYAEQAEGVRAPLASDRCTVFMERDINHYFNRGYTTAEILATALHSVRENYLHKVADEGAIGTRICFQGATAKNRALVAAFEQKLGRPILVSRYCHLTGAYGAALVLKESGDGRATSFRGLDLYREEIPVETEFCEYCNNNCRIRLTTVKGDRVAYGFLCGRDYETRRRVRENSSGFDLLSARRKVWKETRAVPPKVSDGADRALVGLPTGLYLAEAQPFWITFFQTLGVSVVTSDRMDDSVQRGRRVAGAEFCAPMMQLHGQVEHLLQTAKYVFLPVQLDTRNEGDEGLVKSYCYYSQMVSSILPALDGGAEHRRFLRPLVRPGDETTTVDELYRCLSAVVPTLTRGKVVNAHRTATRVLRRFSVGLRSLYQRLIGERTGAYDVVLLGRPYTVLSREMNHRIPSIVGKHGIRAFYQDMIPVHADDREPIAPLLSEVPWSYAARVLEVAAHCARTDGIYPILVTSFKCSPDAFIVDYFKQTLELYRKPYLILQLDDHDSSVGYETRIEAALRAFKNHSARMTANPSAPAQATPAQATPAQATPTAAAASSEGPAVRAPAPERRGISVGSARVGPVLSPSMDGKTVLFPRWDALTNRLIVAALKGRGIDARLLPEDHSTIQRAMRTNSGQCIPVNIMAEESIDYVRSHNLDPENTVLWMPKAKWACNIPLYPHHVKSLFDAAGIPIGVYSGDFTMRDISLAATYDAYFAYLFGGVLRRIGCMVRPYELHPGETNRIIAESMALLDDVFRARGSKSDAWEEVVHRLLAIERNGKPRRPQVAVFGDLYVRDNDTANQNLIETIETAGGEVVTTPYSDYVKVIANAHFRKLRRNRDLLQWGSLRAVHGVLTTVERRFYRPLSDIMPDGPDSVAQQDIDRELAKFNMRPEQSGESVENVLKIFHILRHHPDVSLFVQASPAFCCPSLVTEALASRVQNLTGVPVVSVTYDGTGTFQNDVIVPYLELAG